MIKNIITNVQTENKTDANPDYWSRPAVTEKVVPPFSPFPPVNPSPGRLTGKIARLPADLRNSVNQWITDAVPFDTISQRLADLGHPGITHQNISKWKLFGYQKWLHHQEQLDDQRARYEMGCQMAKELGLSPDSTNACIIMITTRLYELLLSSADQSDPETVRKDTLQILQLSRSLSVFFSQNSRTDRLAFDKQRHQDKLAARAELKRSKTFHSEDRALNTFVQMLGLKPRTSNSPYAAPAAATPSPLNGVRGETAPDASNPQSSSAPHPTIQHSSPPAAPSRHPAPPCATQNTNPDPTLKPLSPDGTASSPSPDASNPRPSEISNLKSQILDPSTSPPADNCVNLKSGSINPLA